MLKTFDKNMFASRLPVPSRRKKKTKKTPQKQTNKQKTCLLFEMIQRLAGFVGDVSVELLGMVLGTGGLKRCKTHSLTSEGFTGNGGDGKVNN